jgi:hypothetical protein
MRYYNIVGLDTVMSERLYSHMIALMPELHYQGDLFVANIDWVRFKIPTEVGSHGWTINFLPERVLKEGNLFRCGPLTIHITPENSERLCGKILDFVDDMLRVSDAKSENLGSM